MSFFASLSGGAGDRRFQWRWPVFLMCAALVIAVAWIDQQVHYSVRFEAVYFALTAVVVWFAGPVPAAGIAALAVTLGIFPDIIRFMGELSRGTVLWNGAGTMAVYLAAIVVLTVLRTSWVRQQEAARTDPLTGLPNRRALYDVLEAEVQRARRYGTSFAFAYLDLDGFKELNDRYGHQAGDKALRVVGRSLHERLRDADLVGRLGGDEFAVLLPETSLDGAVTLVERVLTAIREELEAEGWEGVTASAGIHVPADGVPDAEEVVRRADDLMYEAKRAGRSQIRAAGPEDPQ